MLYQTTIFIGIKFYCFIELVRFTRRSGKGVFYGRSVSQKIIMVLDVLSTLYK